jgi:hypothetical protein
MFLCACFLVQWLFVSLGMDGRFGDVRMPVLLIQVDLDFSVTDLAAMAATAYRTPKISCPQPM